MGNVRIRLVPDNGHKSAHLLTFPSGLPSDLNSMKFKIESVSNETRIQSERGHHDYTGCSLKQSRKFTIGIFDRSTKKLRIPANSMSNLVTMKRIVHDSDHALTIDRNVTSYAETKKMLIDEFGSKKRQRSMRAQEMNQVDITTAGSAGALQHALHAGAQLHDSSESQSDSTRSYLPPYNTTATERHGMYPMERLVPESVLLTIDIKPFSNRLKSQRFTHEGPQDEMPFAFIVSRLQSIRQSSPGRDIVRDQLRLAGLLSYMMGLYLKNNTLLGSVSQLSSSIGCSEDVAEYLINQFRQEKTLPSGKIVYTATGSHRVKLLCYICVLSLTISGFSLSKVAFDQLRNDLKLSDDLLYTHFHQIGSSIKRRSTADNQVTVSLSAPLKLPPQSSGSSKRNRK